MSHAPADTTNSISSISSDNVYCDVVIVGAGVAGASALYHLVVQQQNNRRNHSNNSNDSNESSNTPLRIHIIDAGTAPGEGLQDRLKSGTAVLTNTSGRISKMMTQLYACSTTEFILHHGRDGARRYLNAAREGLRLQKALAKEAETMSTSTSIVVGTKTEQNNATTTATTTTTQLIRELGSFYVAYEADRAALRHEFDLLVSLTTAKDDSSNATTSMDGLEWYDKEQLIDVAGCSRDFDCAIYLPHDAIIDSSLYAKRLLEMAVAKSTSRSNSTSDSDSKCAVITSHMNTTVGQIKRLPASALLSARASVTLHTGVTIYCRHVVMATGAFTQMGAFPSNSTTSDSQQSSSALSPTVLALLKPCYSYLVHVPIAIDSKGSNSIMDASSSTDASFSSSNFFTYNFTHDWSFVEGAVRTSGEDHYTAYKEARCTERCRHLIDWTHDIYHCEKPHDDYNAIPQQFGIYSETPDHAPLIGTLHDDRDDRPSPICYLLGCNAWGQAILSYSASLVPALLGYRSLSESECDIYEQLLSIRRFAHLPRYET